jgi:hypothetical protein
MVRPSRFGFNPETAATNAFQRPQDRDESASIQAAVLGEFDALVDQLERAGVRTIVAADTPLPAKPDAIFPNNWVSFHADGTIALYPMMAPNRRLERREAVIDQVLQAGALRVSASVDLSYREAEGKYLEGTGSLVLDRAAHIAYACLSQRTDLDVLGEFAQRLDYELVPFDAEDAGGQPIYHTNVMMAVGTGFAVLCTAAIRKLEHRAAVSGKLTQTGHALIEISNAQMHEFAGNLLELDTPRGKLIAISARAWSALDASQRQALERHGEPLIAAIPTIERLGGGGIRCMLAEIHLPSRE